MMTKRHLLLHEKDYYSRKRPHWQPENAVLFMTTRLYGSLPKYKVKELKEKQKAIAWRLKRRGLSAETMKKEMHNMQILYYDKYEKLLDENSTGPHWFKEERIAKIWTDALLHFDQDRYKVICSTVMSNHVHFVFYKLDRSLARIMKVLKGFSAREANKVLGKTGQSFWEKESYDRMVRNRIELGNTIRYVLDNPVKVGLVKHWTEWAHNYVHPDFLKFVND